MQYLITITERLMAHRKAKAAKESPSVTQKAEQRYFRLSEAAAYLGSTPWFVSAAVRNGDLPYIPVGKRYVVDRADLDAFAAKQRVAA